MRYISDLNISFSLPVSGGDKRFCFAPLVTGGSIYVTTTDAEVEALEASPMYGRIYRRAPGQEEAVPVSGKKGKKNTSPKRELLPVNGIATWQEAAEYLASHYDVEPALLSTPDGILAQASAQGIVFKDLQ